MKKYQYNRTRRTDKYFFMTVDKKHFDEIEQYGPIVQIFSTDEWENVEDLNIARMLLDDLASGRLSPTLEGIVRCIQTDGGKFSEKVADLVNPDDIIDTAGFWDEPEFVEWFSSKYTSEIIGAKNTFSDNCMGIKTHNGGIAFARKISK
jgi:hypothetical protein